MRKEETIEEVAERFQQNFKTTSEKPYSLIFKLGYEYAQQQNKNLYSEEEVLNVLRDFYKTFDPIKNPPITSTIPLWFEQFKKKQ